MKRLILAIGLVGCTDRADRVDPPIDVLPAGVWEPAPGAWIWDASLTAENGTVWWTYVEHRSFDNDVWLAATTATGEHRIEPSRVDPGEGSIWSPQVAVTPSAVIVATRGRDSVLRRFDRSGSPLGNPYPVVVDDGGAGETDVRTIELVATVDGGAQLVAALLSETAEVAMVELDPAGTPTRTVLVGAPDLMEPGGSTTNAIAAAPRPDGSTLVAWDRYYNGCISTRPAATLTAPVTGQTIGTIQLVRDVTDRSEALPAVAAAGSTAYIAWQSGYGNMPLQLAKYPDVATVLAEVGDANETNRDVMIALAAPGRGAIAWIADQAGTLNVVAFAESGGTVRFGTPRVMPAVTANTWIDSVGLEHVGDDRYVLGWIEGRELSEEERLYATELDFAAEVLRVAPPVEARPLPAASTMRRRVPCP